MRERIHRLIDRVWPRAALIPLGLAALIALVTLFAQPAKHDDDRVRDTLSKYVDAVGNRDGIEACKFLTAHAQQLVTAGIPGTPCASYIHSFGADIGGLGGVKVHIARDLPDKVVLDASNLTSPSGQPVGRVVDLVKSGGKYLIDSLGYAGAAGS
jgi:hypothetical protein